ncbi:MAG: TRAM domain-containing protein, partial [Caldimonas sp.]
MTGADEWLRIESLDLDAQGVAHNVEGKVVFVEDALPGEEVRVAVKRRKNAWEQASPVDRRAESAQRVAPRCRHFGVCGGCRMQHLDVAAQVAVKQRVLEDALWHLGKVRPEQILRPLQGPAWRYRQRARLSVRHVAKKGGVLVGFHERKSSFVADLSSCEVLPRHVSELLLPLRALIGAMTMRDRLPQIELAVGDDVTVLVLRHLEPLPEGDLTLLRRFARDHGIEWWLQPHGPASACPLDGQGSPLAYRLAEFGLTMPFRPSDFTQVNQAVNEALVSRAVRLLAPAPGDAVIDWFCGLGNFTLPLATRAARVVGV